MTMADTDLRQLIKAHGGWWSRPVSRVLSWAIIHLGPPSPTASSDLPGSPCGRGHPSQNDESTPLFGLAPGGVYRAAACYQPRGALLPHHFTLTQPSPWRAPARRYVFCATFLQVTLTGRYPAHCPTEFGLSSPHAHRSEHARRSSGCLRRNVKEQL